MQQRTEKAVEPRTVDPQCFDADPDPAQNLDADPDPDPDPGGGVGQPKMCIPHGKILGTPLRISIGTKMLSRIRIGNQTRPIHNTD
jgi:hypothetical protein